jgi:hypothetical protein
MACDEWRLFSTLLRSLRARHMRAVMQILVITAKLINHLKTDIPLRNIQQSSTYITENTSRLHYDIIVGIVSNT